MKLILPLALLVAVSPAAAQSASAQQGSGDEGARAAAVIARLFGQSVEVARERKPYHFVGDFNGDGSGDLLAVVKLKAAPGGLPKNVAVRNPWGYESKGSPGSSNLALVIVHGTRGGWDVPGPSGVYLLADREFFSTPIWESAGQDDTISVRRRGAGRGGSTVKASGDTITLATEAGSDTTLYWDGKTYRLETPQEEP